MPKLTPHTSNDALEGFPVHDYDMIESAVMETARGRWFLQEYAKRNRIANTDEVLTAIENMGQKLATPAVNFEEYNDSIGMRANDIRISIGEMQHAIALTRQEISSLIPPEGYDGPFAHSTGELDLVVDATDKATRDILSHAEAMQETAWILRESGAESALCDVLDTHATEIYVACSFQDLTGQRIRKVIQALQFIEDRINSLTHVWMGDDSITAAEEKPEMAPWLPNAHRLTNGPSAPGEGLDQDDIDSILSIKHTAKIEMDVDGAPLATEVAHEISLESLPKVSIDASTATTAHNEAIFERVAQELAQLNNTAEAIPNTAQGNTTEAANSDTPIEPVKAKKAKRSGPIDYNALSFEEKYALFA